MVLDEKLVNIERYESERVLIYLQANRLEVLDDLIAMRQRVQEGSLSRSRMENILVGNQETSEEKLTLEVLKPKPKPFKIIIVILFQQSQEIGKVGWSATNRSQKEGCLDRSERSKLFLDIRSSQYLYRRVHLLIVSHDHLFRFFLSQHQCKERAIDSTYRSRSRKEGVHVR